MLLTVDAAATTLPPVRGTPALPQLSAALGNLPSLGCVLCQTRTRAPLPEAALERWLQRLGTRMPVADHPLLHGLLRVTSMRAVAMIDSDGPHECLELVGVDGAVQLRVWLLPDSDFLAWDRLLERHGISSRAAHASQMSCLERLAQRLSRQGRQRWVDSVVQFRMQRLAGLNLLGMVPTAISALGRARAERLALASY